MDKNKSIDGLRPRHTQKTATSSLKATKKTTTRKTTAKKATPKKATPKKTAVKPSTKVRTKKTTVKKTATKATPKNIKQLEPLPSPQDKPDITAVEDFLKPVQAFNFDSESGKLEAASNKNQPSTDQSNPNQDTDQLTKKNKAHKVKKPMSKKRKITLSIILIILLLILGAGIAFVIWGNDIIAKITGGQGNILDLVFQEEKYEPLKTDENGRTNILAFGTSGYNMDGEEGNGTHDGAQLTDSIMVISLNQETGDFAMLSLPRDLKASPTCTATGKINEVYWCNNMNNDNEQAGAEALMEEVGSILGIDFQYYAHLNWGSLVQIVNTLGGINVTLDEDIADYGWTNAIFEAGKEYTIDGEQALGLARARHGTASGDFTRGASQQKILIGIKDKIFEQGLAITDIINLASTLGDNLRTNFSLDEMRTLAHLTSEFDFNSSRQVSLIEPEMLVTTGSINGISYVLPVGGANYYTKIQNYVAKMFSNDPRDYEDYSILVLNATETPGLATSEKNTLEEDEYQNIYIDDAPEGEHEGDYILYTVKDTAPGVKKLLEQKYNTTAKPLEDLPANISQDYNFVIIINKTESE